MARIDYVELPSVTAHEVTRGFYAKAFGWAFTDYGPDYAATTTGDVDVGLNGQPGEALGSPAWLPDGSLVYERRLLAGSNEAVRIERAQPGQPGQMLAEHASSPAVSPSAGQQELASSSIDAAREASPRESSS